MKKIRCTLLCLSLLSAMCLTAGCRSDKKESTSGANFNETTTSQAPATTAAGGTNQSSGAGTDMSDGYTDTSYGYESGAGSMSTDEGASLPGTNGTGNTDGTSGDGLMDDLGSEITSAIDDLNDAMETTKAR